MKQAATPPHHTAANGHDIAGVGTFMVAIGAIIEHTTSGKILIMKRADTYQKGSWEFVYGRIDQGEDPITGLQREVAEEAGITDVTVGECFSQWHIHRGEERPENEVIGLSFACQTPQSDVQLSTEHSEYRWVKPEEALELITVEGIRKDLEKYIAWKRRQSEVAQLQDKAQRALADYQNLVRRTQEEKLKLIQLANQDFITILLEPLEHLHMAAAQLKDAGLDMVVKQLWDRLQERGLTVIDPLGEPFDVNTMEVVEHQSEGHTVIKVLKRGYLLNGQVIQHAKVITGKVN